MVVNYFAKITHLLPVIFEDNQVFMMNLYIIQHIISTM
jgi:hypothetical protein